MAPVEISTDLPTALIPVAWLIGTWEGFGVGTRIQGEDKTEYQFRQRLVFDHDGRDFLSFDSALWDLDATGEQATPDARESGYWRLGAAGAIELVVAAETGSVEIYVGQATGPRIELATDVVGRTATAAPYTAGRRLYGSVEGDLLYAHDAAFADEEGGLRPLRSARLRRQS